MAGRLWCALHRLDYNWTSTHFGTAGQKTLGKRTIVHSRSSLSRRSVRPFLQHDHTDSFALLETGDTMRRCIELVMPLAMEAQLRET